MPPERQPAHAPAMLQRLARRRRDASLARVGTVTKGIVAASMLAAGALTAYVAKALPGHRAGATTTGSASTSSTSAPASPSASPPGGPTDDGGSSPPTAAPSTPIAPPTTAPTRTTSPPVVSSGAS